MLQAYRGQGASQPPLPIHDSLELGEDATATPSFASCFSTRATQRKEEDQRGDMFEFCNVSMPSITGLVPVPSPLECRGHPSFTDTSGDTPCPSRNAAHLFTRCILTSRCNLPIGHGAALQGGSCRRYLPRLYLAAGSVPPYLPVAHPGVPPRLPRVPASPS